MKLLSTIIAVILSTSAFADFSDAHLPLCAAKKGICKLILAPKEANELSATCHGKLGDMNCKVMMLKTSDSSSMTLLCGEEESPLLSQVLEAQVMSYDVSAVISNASGETVIINDPKQYHLLSNPVLEIQLSQSDRKSAKVVLNLQDRSVELSHVNCD